MTPAPPKIATMGFADIFYSSHGPLTSEPVATIAIPAYRRPKAQPLSLGI
jgi:hypothetical protein